MTQTHAPNIQNSTQSNIQSFQGMVPLLADGVYIHCAATIIGDVVIGEHSSIWPNAVVRGDVNSIRIGSNSNVQDSSVLHVNHRSGVDPKGAPLVIGNNVTIGHSVILHGCTVGDECLIGMGSIVMDKAVVHKHVLLAAGSLVPEGKVLESGYLYVGRPAKKIRALTPEEIAFFRYSANNYVQLKEQYLLGV